MAHKHKAMSVLLKFSMTWIKVSVGGTLWPYNRWWTQEQDRYKNKRIS